MIWYGMIQESRTPGRVVIPLDLWPVLFVVLSLGGHTDTYRTVVYGHGAFELCLPSLGILYQNCIL